jgi:hypothetical protein
VRVIFILPDLFHAAIEPKRWNIDCLRSLIAHSDKQHSANVNARILFLSHILACRGENFVESRFAYWSDFQKPPAGYCYYCEPIHLRADMSDAIVFDRSHFNLTLDEAQSLVNAINPQLQGNSYRIEIADPYRWYLLSDIEIASTIPALRQLHGRPVGAVLTNPGYAAEWRHLMNELQILLHQQPVNTERIDCGELPVNGVWIHPGSVFEARDYTISRVVTSSPFAQEVCRSLVLDCMDKLNESVLTGKGDILIFDESLMAKGDVKSLQLQLEAMEADWFQPMRIWLRQGKIDEIIIDPVDGRRFIIRHKFLRRFWKRMHPLDAYVKQKP